MEHPVRLTRPHSNPPKPPRGLTSKAAKEFFCAVVQEYEMHPHHRKLLEQACFAWQRHAEALALVAAEGLVLTDTRNGRQYAHPAFNVQRDSAVLFSRLVREMGLDLIPAEAPRPPVRQGRQIKFPQTS
jgi:P27 family predicted phage terminase small subunit